MPFTISHAVLAPPLAKLSGDRLPIAAIAIGSMTPIFIDCLHKPIQILPTTGLH
jgi:hypothetical protein